LRFKERGYLPTTGVQVLSATVSEQAGQWSVSVQVQVPQDHAAVPITTATSITITHATPATAGPVVGVDLGLTTLATCSDGPVVANPRHVKRRLKRIKRQHRVVSRRQQGSQNRKRAVRTLGRLYRRVAHQRADTLHQRTTRLANTKAVLVLAELHVAGMLKNHHLAQAIADVGFYEFKRQLRYTAVWYGSQLMVADRWYPSSKTCSGCGWVDTSRCPIGCFAAATPSDPRAR
jgi:putative transposase